MAQRPLPPGRGAGMGDPRQQYVGRIGRHPLQRQVAEALQAVDRGHVAKAGPAQHVVHQRAGPGHETGVLEHQGPGPGRGPGRGRRPVQGRGDPRHQGRAPGVLPRRRRHGPHLLQAVGDGELGRDLQQAHARAAQALQGGRRGVAADHHQVRPQRQQGLGIVGDGGIGRRAGGHSGHVRLVRQAAQARDLVRIGDPQQDGVDAGKQGHDPLRAAGSRPGRRSDRRRQRRCAKLRQSPSGEAFRTHSRSPLPRPCVNTGPARPHRPHGPRSHTDRRSRRPGRTGSRYGRRG